VKRPHVKHDDQGGSGSPARGTGVTRALLLISAGAAAAVVLVLHYDVSAIGDSLGAVGGFGLVAIVAANFVPMMLCSVAWRSLLPGEIGVAAFIWFRYTRDAAGDILGFIPAAGEFAALREMIRYGVECRLGAGVLVADLTLQMIAQLAFTVAGVALLFDISSGTPMTRAALVGLGLLVGILVAFIFVQHWGLGRMLAALARCILPDALRSYPAMLAEFDEQLRNTYADRRRVAVATTLHIAAWFIGIGEAGLALGLMGSLARPESGIDPGEPCFRPAHHRFFRSGRAGRPGGRLCPAWIDLRPRSRDHARAGSGQARSRAGGWGPGADRRTNNFCRSTVCTHPACANADCRRVVNRLAPLETAGV
jgi:hypothetical protein